MNKKIISFFVFFLLFFIFPLCSALGQSQNKFVEESTQSELLVKFKNKDKIEIIEIDFDSCFSQDKKECFNYELKKYRDNPEVEYVDPNFLYKASLVPNDYYEGEQWYLKKIKADKAWNKINKGPEIIIAVIDSGIQINHPDLKNNIWKNLEEIEGNGIDDDKNGFIDDINGWDFIENISDPSPKFREGFTESGILHGTIVAGLIAAEGNNRIGISGVSWKSLIMPLRVLNDKGQGRTSEVIRGIDYAIKNGADIINLSFVGFGYSEGLQEAIARAYRAGVVVVAAAGNEQNESDGYDLDESPMYPVCNDGKNGENMVVGVAATDTIDQKAIFSSHGFSCVDIAAPGVSIFSTVVYRPDKKIDEKYFEKYYDGYWSGTSMATPLVSGALALIESANPEISGKQAVDILLSGADNINKLNPLYFNQLGRGRLNVESSVNKAIEILPERDIFLLVSPYSNNESVVKIMDYQGIVKGQFFAYDKNFRGGVNVTAGDIDGDGKDEIITGAGNGGGPQVRIFNNKGEVLGQFFAYDKNFRGGVRVATGDVKIGARDYGKEIITAPGVGGGPHIRVFNRSSDLKMEFFAYGDQYRGGVQISAGDFNNDGIAEIITGTGPVGTPYVRVFKTDGSFISSFYAYDEENESGVNVSVMNLIK